MTEFIEMVIDGLHSVFAVLGTSRVQIPSSQ